MEVEEEEGEEEVEEDEEEVVSVLEEDMKFDGATEEEDESTGLPFWYGVPKY